MWFQKMPKLLQLWLGFLALNIFPTILVSTDNSLIKFIPFYLVIYIPTMIIASLLLQKNNFNLQSISSKAVLLIPFLMPFVVTALYPFSGLNLILVLGLIIFCLTLPLWNISLTRWLYTLGGLTPMPTDVSIILSKERTGFGEKKYQRYVQNATAIYPIIVFTVLVVLPPKRHAGEAALMVILAQVGSFIALFGIALALGVALKKTLQKNN